ncbi:type II toxin-antitoxin system PemK/MazF family toxin [Leptolyngbya sp. CCNP1308]|uniref:type II toxin-antitoxin system PemK/MazF family toxin n=1 Tax=Leptolyngbya sp. CCNP1308 TaxID=3110255 RepID=UPI002B200F7F|nr:type II toxin-antitoxin system PemK/MazF family toxin [Leptolyngbya sp. CCNP1308]MEA5451003.1 type II toxin-antitoxin system PemK/MazF family toxin [Leptolyngbya sp. CCNP1308]
MYVPNRGDFIWLSFDPQAGHEQRGNRPALVVSQSSFNAKMGFVFVCPISNTQRRNPFYVKVPEGEAVTGVIMADQLRSLDFKARNAQFIAHCPDLLLQDVLRRIKPILF